MKFANAYTPKAERADPRWVTVNEEPTMTQQSDANETDINVIMAKYQQTGQLPRVLTEPLFGDFTDAPDYRTAVETINAANAAFMEIPAKIRAQFGNDPAEFMKFAGDPKNKEELQKLGLLKDAPKPTIEQETLEAIKALKPQENSNGGGQK